MGPKAANKSEPVAGTGTNKVAPEPATLPEQKPAAVQEDSKPKNVQVEVEETKKKEGAEKDEDEGSDSKPEKSVDDTHSKSKEMRSQQQKEAAEKMKNGCQKCCGKFMACIAHDAIHGSFVGPHPVSFLFCCAIFKKKCPGVEHCSRPFCVASIATKLMNFIMLGIVATLAGFFIIPWPHIPFISPNSTALSSFYPCQGNKMIRYRDANGGCSAHAGYFMAYRCFFAYATVMLTHCLLMLRVSNTKDDPYRSKYHRGFWFYKYLYLTILLFVYFLMVNGEHDKEGVFEFVASVIGNIAHMFFSIIEIIFILDLVELWVYNNKTGNGKWANFIYWMVTVLVFFAATMIYIKVWVEYSSIRLYVDPVTGMYSPNWPPWPLDNCIEGEKAQPDWKHTGLILASTSVIILLIIVIAFRKILGFDERYPYTGWLQTGVMILFNLSYLWSALTNSSNIHSRPHCNVGMDFFSTPKSKDPTGVVRPGSWDQYFGRAGLFHGVMCIVALLYFAFVHGPRSNTAPMSLLYTFVFRIVDRIPVYPDMDDEEMAMPIGFLQAIQKTKVWDDEQVQVAQSWSLFYFMMVLGSFSLMMAMTNFTNPWAADHYNSSNVAFGCKFGTAVIASLIYIFMLMSQCSSIRDFGRRDQTIRRRSVREVLDFEFEMEDEIVELNLGAGVEDSDKGGSSNKQGFTFHLAGKSGRKSEFVNLESGKEKEAGGAEGAALSS